MSTGSDSQSFRTGSSANRKKFLVGGVVGVVGVAVVLGVAIGVPLGLNNDQKTVRITAEGILSSVPLIDGHNDLSWQYFEQAKNDLDSVDLNKTLIGIWNTTHTDIPRLRQGMVGGQFWPLYSSCETQGKDAVRGCLDQADNIRRFVDKYPETFEFVTTSAGIMDAFKRGKIASLIGMEGGHCIDSSLAALRMFYELGVRYMTLTHSCRTPWADNSQLDDNYTAHNHVGLTAFGEVVIHEMNRMGMLIDLSHVSHTTMNKTLEVTKAPVIFSHSSAYSLCNHTRNVQDYILQRMKDNGGIVMVNFYNNYVTCSNDATLQDVVAHIQHVHDIAGPDHVGIGADYDGVPRTPVGLEDVSKYPALFEELINRGWKEEDLKKLAGENLLRVFGKVEQVSRELQTTTRASDTLIPTADLGDRTCRAIPYSL